jgi:CRP-like cAMP-binding protein
VGATAPVIRPDWRALGDFAGLDERTLRTTCDHRRFGRGAIVFHEGDPAGGLHLIDRGRVAIRLTTPLGDTVTIDVLQAGDTFGEQALVDGLGARTATVSIFRPTLASCDASSGCRTCFRRTGTGGYRSPKPTSRRWRA